jgi:hypothetical protein
MGSRGGSLRKREYYDWSWLGKDRGERGVGIARKRNGYMEKELNEGPACSCNITISILVSVYPTIKINLPTSSRGKSVS